MSYRDEHPSDNVAGRRIQSDGQPLNCECHRPDCSARVYRLQSSERYGNAHYQRRVVVRQ